MYTRGFPAPPKTKVTKRTGLCPAFAELNQDSYFVMAVQLRIPHSSYLYRNLRSPTG
jgi:hypothetical protein